MKLGGWGETSPGWLVGGITGPWVGRVWHKGTPRFVERAKKGQCPHLSKQPEVMFRLLHNLEFPELPVLGGETGEAERAGLGWFGPHSQLNNFLVSHAWWFYLPQGLC